ncbi:cleavage stimulation factor subunit 1 isoform X1 [Homalodisca vitripennis]|uniref:cleavage stimulation factor subunit 1 isoform X1 n=1 Tax=Homalodisca vitripennis TaxID=197043 RepID=UPI001EEA4A3A|nr:cleavage stimulation factor subunit 1 isoform X1 [Homalodisca vitripennis]
MMKDETEEKNCVKQREALYRLIISQLYYDGYSQIALNLTTEVQADPPCPPSERLLHVVNAGLQHEPDRHKNREPVPGLNPIQEILIGPGLDLEYETEVDVTAPEPALYETAYVTSHKANCRAGAFSCDGQLVATGSVDSSIKILDVDRMLAKSCPDGLEPTTDTQGHPVIRTLYDHLEEVTCLEFHPKEPFLISGSRDCTIKFFDYAKASVKKAFKTLTDVEQVKCMSFHPSGDFLVVGTNHPVIRMYDFNTGQCYVCNVPSHQHTASITSIKFSQNARYFASTSRDGSIKLWDGVSNRCVNTFVQLIVTTCLTLQVLPECPLLCVYKQRWQYQVVGWCVKSMCEHICAAHCYILSDIAGSPRMTVTLRLQAEMAVSSCGMVCQIDV